MAKQIDQKLHVELAITAAAQIGEVYNLSGEILVVGVTENVGAANEVEIQGRLFGTSQWSVVETVVGNSMVAADFSIYDQVRFVCTLYDSSAGFIYVSAFRQNVAAVAGGTATAAKQDTGNSSLASINNKLGSLGQKTMAGSAPVVMASNQTAIPVFFNAPRTSYSASVVGLSPAASATDIFTITGAAGKIVRVTRMGISGERMNAGPQLIQLLKRSTANSGGTSAVTTEVPHFSTSPAASAVVRSYTANPTTGSLIGILRSALILLPKASQNDGDSFLEYEFSTGASRSPSLLSTSEVVAINLNGQTVAGGNLNLWVEWTEEDA